MGLGKIAKSIAKVAVNPIVAVTQVAKENKIVAPIYDAANSAVGGKLDTIQAAQSGDKKAILEVGKSFAQSQAGGAFFQSLGLPEISVPEDLKNLFKNLTSRPVSGEATKTESGAGVSTSTGYGTAKKNNLPWIIAGVAGAGIVVYLIARRK